MAKIPFDIKYRSQIESGEYKVETRDGKPVRIVCWDRKDDYPIMALTTNLNKSESYISCYANGRMTIHSQEFPSDLFIVTPESEPLTKLEKTVFNMLVERTNEATISEKQARKYAPIFLEIAKDEIYSHESLVEYAKVSREQGKAEALRTHATKLTENLVKSGLDKDSIPYHLIEFMCNLYTCQNWKEIEETAELYAIRLKAAAMKDLPRWKEYATTGMQKRELSLTLYSGVYEVNDLFIDRGLYIPISDLEKLPGFKEDEK